MPHSKLFPLYSSFCLLFLLLLGSPLSTFLLPLGSPLSTFPSTFGNHGHKRVVDRRLSVLREESNEDSSDSDSSSGEYGDAVAEVNCEKNIRVVLD